MNVHIKDTGGKKIDVLTWPREVDEDGCMHFDNSNCAPSNCLVTRQNVKPDVVVFATGYQREFPFLSSEYPDVAQCDVRGIYKSGDVDCGFIGFVRPSIGKSSLH